MEDGNITGATRDTCALHGGSLPWRDRLARAIRGHGPSRVSRVMDIPRYPIMGAALGLKTVRDFEIAAKIDRLGPLELEEP